MKLDFQFIGRAFAKVKIITYGRDIVADTMRIMCMHVSSEWGGGTLLMKGYNCDILIPGTSFYMQNSTASPAVSYCAALITDR